MTMAQIGLMDAIGARIDYLSRAQTLISQNVANADTPGYRPKELTPVDFGAMLGTLMGNSQADVKMMTPNKAHLMPGGINGINAKKEDQRMTYEVAPAGNAVILEEQLTKANDVRMNYELMVNLYSKNMGLMRAALGTGR